MDEKSTKKTIICDPFEVTNGMSGHQRDGIHHIFEVFIC
jgi:hypothetical protein